MSSHHLREDNTCLNCGHKVEKRFCSNCGQENIESRQSFGHLIRHFFEDITHYEGRFWQTMKYLFTRPGYLTRSFLEGKRSRYVPPVRLYIFISFVTFLLPYLLPDFRDDHYVQTTAPDSTRRITSSFLFTRNDGKIALYVPNEYRSVEEMDSIQKTLPEEKRLNGMERFLYKKYIRMQKFTPEELADKYLHSYSANFPKALFIYMPLFALVIWLFHSKKRWFYYDHAILTLHYFSFMLISFCIYQILHTVVGFLAPLSIKAGFSAIVIFFLFPILFLVYFYIAHKRFFQERIGISILKSTGILVTNSILFLLTLVGLGFLTIFLLH